MGRGSGFRKKFGRQDLVFGKRFNFVPQTGILFGNAFKSVIKFLEFIGVMRKDSPKHLLLCRDCFDDAL